jgi:hypothetical protein
MRRLVRRAKYQNQQDPALQFPAVVHLQAAHEMVRRSRQNGARSQSRRRQAFRRGIEPRGNRIFSLLAIKTCDDKAWSRSQTHVERNKRMAQIERKMELELRKFEAELAREKEKEAEGKPKLTPEEKEARLEEILSTD